MADFYAGLGRIVLYNLAPEGAPADYRPATLLVHLDGRNDAYRVDTNCEVISTGIGWATSRVHGEVGEASKWIWPQELVVSS